MRLGFGFVFTVAFIGLGIAMFTAANSPRQIKRRDPADYDSTAIQRQWQYLAECRASGALGSYTSDGAMTRVEVGPAWYLMRFSEKRHLLDAMRHRLGVPVGKVDFVDLYSGKVVATFTPFEGLVVR